MGRIGSGVRDSVSLLQKYSPGSVLRCPMAAENGGYDQGGLTSLRLRRITSSPSQTLRRRLVRTTDAAVSAPRLPPFVFITEYCTWPAVCTDTLKIKILVREVNSVMFLCFVQLLWSSLTVVA